MTAANYTANQLWLQLVKHQHKINVLVVVLLAVFLLAYAAELTWRLLPQPAEVGTTTSKVNRAAPVKNQTNRLDLAAVKKLNLFGDLTAEPIEDKPVTDAPVTRLNLTLTGVVTSSAKDQGAAIIENKSKQQTYGIGEKIDGTNASLKEVYVDRVIIKNGAVSETLMLEGIDYKKASSPKTSRSTNTARSQPGSSGPQRRTLSNDALAASRELQEKPASFVDYIAVSPHRPNGELSGYRVSPGKKPALFKAAGLKAGDVITELNGLDLTDMQQALEAMNMLKELQSLQMSVQRKDELITIYLDLPEGEEES